MSGEYEALQDEGFQERFIWILEEWSDMVGRDARDIRYSEKMLQLAFVVHSLSPIAYEFMRRYIRFPSRKTLDLHFMEELDDTKLEILDKLSELLRNYREVNGCTGKVAVAVGMDATSVTRTGMKMEKGPGEGVMVFMLLPLCADLPSAVIHVASSRKMKIGADTATQKRRLLRHLRHADFDVVAITSDADPGTNAWHSEFFRRYANERPDGSFPIPSFMDDAFSRVRRSSRESPGWDHSDDEGMMELAKEEGEVEQEPPRVPMPISDLLHLLKAIRRRVGSELLIERRVLATEA
jgi:hypothetical protein